MNESKARSILERDIQPDNSLYSLGWYLSWVPGNPEACLDGDFTAEDLEAIAWWMKNKTPLTPKHEQDRR